MNETKPAIIICSSMIRKNGENETASIYNYIGLNLLSLVQIRTEKSNKYTLLHGVLEYNEQQVRRIGTFH